MNKKTKIIWAVSILAVILLVLFFYPKPRVVGGLRGMIGPNETAYREDYSCFGIKHDFCPNWPDYGCDYLCYGIKYNKLCSIQKAPTFDGESYMQEPVNCRGIK